MNNKLTFKTRFQVSTLVLREPFTLRWDREETTKARRIRERQNENHKLFIQDTFIPVLSILTYIAAAIAIAFWAGSSCYDIVFGRVLGPFVGILIIITAATLFIPFDSDCADKGSIGLYIFHAIAVLWKIIFSLVFLLWAPIELLIAPSDLKQKLFCPQSVLLNMLSYSLNQLRKKNNKGSDLLKSSQETLNKLKELKLDLSTPNIETIAITDIKFQKQLQDLAAAQKTLQKQTKECQRLLQLAIVLAPQDSTVETFLQEHHSKLIETIKPSLETLKTMEEFTYESQYHLGCTKKSKNILRLIQDDKDTKRVEKLSAQLRTEFAEVLPESQ